MQVPTDSTAAIERLVRAVSDQAYPFFTAVAAVGLLSMAIIQTIKDLFPIRQHFQRHRVFRWLWERGSNLPPVWKDQNLIGQKAFEVALEDLVRLAADKDSKAFYDLPLEQLCGQINAAAQVVLDNPQGHEALFKCLASSAKTSDIDMLLKPPPEVIRKSRANLTLESEKKDYDDYVDARNRVTHQVQRAIDALQIAVGFRWKLYLQTASIMLSAVIAGFGVFLFSEIQGTIRRLVATFVVAILGGFFAPVARDLVASLQRLRK